jgi:hypothetical protein
MRARERDGLFDIVRFRVRGALHTSRELADSDCALSLAGEGLRGAATAMAGKGSSRTRKPLHLQIALRSSELLACRPVAATASNPMHERAKDEHDLASGDAGKDRSPHG